MSGLYQRVTITRYDRFEIGIDSWKSVCDWSISPAVPISECEMRLGIHYEPAPLERGKGAVVHVVAHTAAFAREQAQVVIDQDTALRDAALKSITERMNALSADLTGRIL